MRPRDDRGLPLPPPHVRLEEAPRLEQAAVFAMSADGRAASLTMARKLTLARKAIDHVVDGDAIPKALFKADNDRPDNHFAIEVFRTAVAAVREALGPKAVAA